MTPLSLRQAQAERIFYQSSVIYKIISKNMYPSENIKGTIEKSQYE
jgi:hypothetical protein